MSVNRCRTRHNIWAKKGVVVQNEIKDEPRLEGPRTRVVLCAVQPCTEIQLYNSSVLQDPDPTV